MPLPHTTVIELFAVEVTTNPNGLSKTISCLVVVSTVFVVVSGAFVVGCVTVASPTYFQTPHWPHVSGLSPSVHHFA